MSPYIGWIVTYMSDEVYHETVDGRRVAYVDLAYGLGRKLSW